VPISTFATALRISVVDPVSIAFSCPLSRASVPWGYFILSRSDPRVLVLTVLDGWTWTLFCDVFIAFAKSPCPTDH
jgi:hypothetical protein